MESAELTKIVIFGSSGFIGSQLQQLMAQSFSVPVLGYSSSDCNLLNSEQLAEVLSGCDKGTSIILCSGVGRLQEDSRKSLWKNLSMIENTLSNLPNTGVRSIIFLSSADVYGMPPKELPVSEKTPVAPTDYYGLSKLLSEQLLIFNPGNKFPATVLRLPGVFGFGDRFKSIVGHFIQSALEESELTVFNEGESLRDFVYVDDVALVVKHFVETPYAGIVNVASGESLSIQQILALVAKCVGKELKLKRENKPGDRVGDLKFDNSHLRSLIPNLKFLPLAEGIRHYITKLKSETGK